MFHSRGDPQAGHPDVTVEARVLPRGGRPLHHTDRQGLVREGHLPGGGRGVRPGARGRDGHRTLLCGFHERRT